jgi:hypothetical protein
VKLVLDLDSSPAFERGLVIKVKPSLGRLPDCWQQLCIQTCACIKQHGLPYSTCLVSKPNWHVNRGSAEHLAKMIKTAITDKEPGNVVQQLLDNSVNYAKVPDSSWLPPTADSNGQYHIHGKIRIASRDAQLDHFCALSPVFEVLGQRKTMLVTPLPRYITSSCCGDSSHGSNRTSPEYNDDEILKDYISREGNRNL